MISKFFGNTSEKGDLPSKGGVRLYEERFVGIEKFLDYVTDEAIVGKPYEYIWNKQTEQ